MTSYIILFIIVFISAVWFIWRLYSNRHTLPCPAWIAWMVELDNPLAKEHKAKSIIETLPLKNSISILDIGCGPGRVSIPLAKRLKPFNSRVTSLDIQQEMLDKVAAKAKKFQIENIELKQGAIELIKPENKYNIILMICVLGEIPEKEHVQTLDKIKSLLISGGILSITETIFDPHFQRHAKVKQFMEANGLVEIYFTGNKLAYTAHYQTR